MRMMNDLKLEVKNLAKTFTLHQRNGMEISGFSDVSFSVKKGALLALTGPSGAGKSSILKTIYRTYLASYGCIEFHRKNGLILDLVSSTESQILALRKQEMGFVTQFLKVLPRITALQTVAAPLLEVGETKHRAFSHAADLLELLGIREELFHVSPLTFSGGEQQRVNIARGVIAPKELLLLDEPTASLDEQSSDKVLNLLMGLKEKGIAMIGIFHDKQKIARVADSSFNVTGNACMNSAIVQKEAA